MKRVYSLVRVLDCIWFVWFIIGSVWSFNANCNGNADHVVRLCVALVFVHIALCIFGCCACCCACCGTLVQIAQQMERQQAPPGATKSQISQLKALKYKEGLIEKDSANCAICLADYEDDEELRYLPCNHHFHSECVDQWLLINKSCPFCKREIDGKESTNEKSSSNV